MHVGQNRAGRSPCNFQVCLVRATVGDTAASMLELGILWYHLAVLGSSYVKRVTLSVWKRGRHSQMLVEALVFSF